MRKTNFTAEYARKIALESEVQYKRIKADIYNKASEGGTSFEWEFGPYIEKDQIEKTRNKLMLDGFLVDLYNEDRINKLHISW